MDFNEENMDQQPINDTTAEPEAPAEETDSGAYRGAGVGQKESPYANSPYYAYQAPDSGYIPNTHYQAPQAQTPPQQPQDSAPVQAPKPPKVHKPRKKMGKTGKRLIATALSLVILGTGCGITAWAVNNRWENETAQLESDFAAQLEDLQKQLDDVAAITAGTSISGTAVSAGTGLTPSQIYAANVNSVVSISNYAMVASSGWGTISSSEQLAGTGSGFIISEDGYVMTNYHVIEGASRVVVTTYIGDEYEATVVGYDELNDVALLKVDATDLDAVVIGSSDELLVGDQVVAIGNALGELTSSMTVGYVSGKDRSITTDGSIINMLQTDAAINSGNSGGPLFNMKGEVVGITSAKYSGSTSSGASIEGIGFAIPIDDVMNMIEDFKNYGYLRNQAYLGVTVVDVEASNRYSLPAGSYVQSVVEGGSADRAGVLPQDIITAIGGCEVDGNTTLTSVLRRFSAGDTTTITVYRSGQEITLDITFDEKPADLNSSSTEETEAGEMPDTGSYEEWYDYFYRYFGGSGNSENGQP